MRKVIGIGETVLDIIFKENQPIGAYPGGSTFNSVISLGRSGVPVSFISEVGNDRVGRQIVDFLVENNVNTDGVAMFPDTKSPVSLAFLDGNNDAEYIFYKDHPSDRLDFKYPVIEADDIVIFGSYYALNPVIRQQVAGLLQYARERQAIIYYDVNFRSSHKSEVLRLTPNLLENLEVADFVRGSRDDFNILYHIDDADKVYHSEIAFYCRHFIYTDGRRPIVVRDGKDYRKEYEVLQTDAVSTVGAGDNFNAGFVFGLLCEGITRQMLQQGLTEEQWDSLISYARSYSSESCKTIYNYVDNHFGERMKARLTTKEQTE